jgi:signal transduction histidine kinase/CheY-like chemotaxis protein
MGMQGRDTVADRNKKRRFSRRPVLTEKLLQSLLGLYRLLRTPLPIDELLQAILDTALDCIPGAQRGSLMVREGDALVFRAASGYDLELLRPVRFPVAHLLVLLPPGGRFAQVESYEEWDAAYLDDASNQILKDHGRLDEIRRSLMTSIIVSETFYGTLVIDNLYSHAPFPSESESLATLFAEQAGALIEHAQLLEQLRMTNARLAEAEKLASLGQLVAGVAHEINNPLTAVLGYVDLLAAEDLDGDLRSAIEQIQFGAERVGAVVRNLQIFARQQRSGESAIEINALIERTLALKQAELALDRIEVRKQLAERLPISWGDPGRISQVLLNLLINAQHALSEQAAPGLISVRSWVERSDMFGAAGGERICIAIADNGPGISADLMPRIFEPFFTTRPVGQGTGLGLSVCYGIIADHGGRIWAESQPGQGATFLIELPVRDALPEQSVLAVARADRPAVSPRGLRILLIEDDSSVVYLVRSALGHENTLVVAADGREALKMLHNQPFELVLCDLRMPGMGGREFYQQLQFAAPQLIQRLLFISGDTTSAETRDFLQQSGRPLLSKPFTPSDLFTAIAALEAAA